MKKKVVIIACGVLLAAALAFSVVPVAAGALHGAAPATISVSDIEAKIVNIQDGAKVDALLAKAVSSGRITAAQSAEIKAWWTANHTTKQISIADIEAKIVNVRDEAKVDALLAKAVSGGRITSALATEIKAYWTANHVTAKPVDISAIEARIVKVQDEAKVDALLAKAVSSGRITAAQATEIKAYWTANHK